MKLRLNYVESVVCLSEKKHLYRMFTSDKRFIILNTNT